MSLELIDRTLETGGDRNGIVERLAFEGGWFLLEPIDDRRTRLIARSRVPRGLPSIGYSIFVEFPHFVMERKMLLGIKARAESRGVARAAAV